MGKVLHIYGKTKALHHCVNYCTHDSKKQLHNCTTKTVQKWPKWSNWSLISDQAAKRDLWCWKEGETSMKALYASLTKQMERIQDLFKIFSPLDPTLALCESAWGSQLSPHPLTTPELHQTVSGPPLPSTRSFRSWLSPLRISGWVLSASQRRSQRSVVSWVAVHCTLCRLTVRVTGSTGGFRRLLFSVTCSAQTSAVTRSPNLLFEASNWWKRLMVSLMWRFCILQDGPSAPYHCMTGRTACRMPVLPDNCFISLLAKNWRIQKEILHQQMIRSHVTSYLSVSLISVKFSRKTSVFTVETQK